MTLFILPFLIGCASYKIPIQTTDHPATPGAATSQIELSSILEINETNIIEVEGDESHACH